MAQNEAFDLAYFRLWGPSHPADRVRPRPGESRLQAEMRELQQTDTHPLLRAADRMAGKREKTLEDRIKEVFGHAR